MDEDQRYAPVSTDIAQSPFHSETPSAPRGWGCVSWMIILVMVGVLLVFREREGVRAELPPPLDESIQSTRGISELQLRMLVGIGEILRRYQPDPAKDIRALYEGNPADAAQQKQHQEMWLHGTFGQRLQFVVLGGELAGPKAALEALQRLDADLKQVNLTPSAEQRQTLNTLTELYQDFEAKKFDAPEVSDPERQSLISRMGWYGRLALTPPESPDQPARQAVMVRPVAMATAMIGVMLGLIVLAIVGSLGVLGLGAGVGLGIIKAGIKPGTTSSGLYAETFALWMMVFFGGFLIISVWPREQDRFLLNLVLTFGSLIVLLWPVVRGLSLRQVLSDVGLSWGRAGIFEPLVGIAGYAMMLPFLAVGFTLTFILMILTQTQQGLIANPGPFEPQHFVSHPAVDVMLRGDRWQMLQIFVLACVGAPIVEEIMFRGVLYRNLRDVTRPWGGFLSCLLSTVWVSFIFAVIHPQGYIAVPALMGIAFGCNLVREWRDSLWASMVVHAMNNGLVMTLLMLATR